MKRLSDVIILTIFVLLGSSCGPAEYINTVSLKAAHSVESARAAGAPKLAPYEYYCAEGYLKLAQEKGGYGYYQQSLAYGEKAEQKARDALRVAHQKQGLSTDSPAKSTGEVR